MCTIRVRLDENGRPEYFHSYFNEPPSEADENARLNALLRIGVSGTGKIEQFGLTAEGVIEGMQILDSLGGN